MFLTPIWFFIHFYRLLVFQFSEPLFVYSHVTTKYYLLIFSMQLNFHLSYTRILIIRLQISLYVFLSSTHLSLRAYPYKRKVILDATHFEDHVCPFLCFQSKNWKIFLVPVHRRISPTLLMSHIILFEIFLSNWKNDRYSFGRHCVVYTGLKTGN